MSHTENNDLFRGDRSKKATYGRKPGFAGLMLLLLVLSLMVAACGNKTNTAGEQATTETTKTNASAATQTAEEPQTQVIEHAMGKTEVPLHPKRVAVFGLEDLTLSLGVPMVYAYDFDGHYLDDQLKALNIPLAGNADFNPNLEAILATQPDLIVVQRNAIDDKAYEELSKIAPTIAYSPDDWEKTIVEIGKATGLEDKAQEVLQANTDKLKQAKEDIISAVGPDKTVVFMRPSDKDLQVFFPSFAPLIYTELGLNPDESVAAFQKDTKDDWGVTTSLEKLPSIGADYVFAIYGGSISTEEEFNENSAVATEVEKLHVWKTMPAVKANHVFKVSARHWMMSGPIADSKVADDVVAAVTGKK